MSFKPPKPFLGGDSPAEAWEKHKQLIEIYWNAAELNAKPNKIQIAILLHIPGEDVLTIYNTMIFSIEPKEDGTYPDRDDVIKIEQIRDAFTNHFTPYKIATYARYLFFDTKQGETENFNGFLLQLKNKARDSNF